jgi:hypothetical protein
MPAGEPKWRHCARQQSGPGWYQPLSPLLLLPLLRLPLALDARPAAPDATAVGRGGKQAAAEERSGVQPVAAAERVGSRLRLDE